MTVMSRAFRLATWVSLAGWGVLFGFPWWPRAGSAVVFTLAVILLCAMYGYFLFLGKRYDPPGSRIKGSFFSLRGVTELFKSPRAVLAGWIHYLAFDLMVGLYIVTDAAHYGIRHGLLLPVLLATLMFGPIGLLLYVALRFCVAPGAMLF
jgi:hypothetical protein